MRWETHLRILKYAYCCEPIPFLHFLHSTISIPTPIFNYIVITLLTPIKNRQIQRVCENLVFLMYYLQQALIIFFIFMILLSLFV